MLNPLAPMRVLLRPAALALLVLGMASPAHAQLDPQFSQFMFNRLAVNPAYAGAANGALLTAIYRNQWVGLPGNPQSFQFSGHTPFWNNRAGAGLLVSHDRLSPLYTTDIVGSYAQRINLGGNHHLAMGLSVGWRHQNLNQDEIRTANSGVPDPAFTNLGSANQVDFGFGLFYHNEKLYVGVSAAHLTEPKLTLTDSNGTTLSRQYRLLAGYDISLSQDVVLSPAAQFRIDEQTLQWQVDVNMNLMLYDRFWLGASYRHEDAVALLVGFHVIPRLRIGYAFDVPLNDLSGGHNGTHEVMASMRIGKVRRQAFKTPRYFN